jgi:hypothetical protein
MVIIDIAGFHKGTMEVHVAMAALLPAAVGPYPQIEGAVAKERGVLMDDTFFQAGGGNHHLVGGCRWVLTCNRPVFHRTERILGQLLPGLGRNTAVEEVWIEGRRTDHGQD